jgi:hypothetical protein
MGNQVSTTSINSSNDKLDNKTVGKLVDYIATHYILTMDFQSLTKLFDKKYCDNLVILTSEVIERHFTDMEITYLAERVKDGNKSDESKPTTATSTTTLEKDRMIFFEKEGLSKLDIKDHIKKRNVCLGIAKFYVKIAHVFAAISKTVNAEIMYTDADNNRKRVSLSEKSTIPKDAKTEVVNFNLCNNLINALINKQDYSDIRDYNDITIQPDVCSVNITSDGETKSLDELPGMPELEELYMDDDYNFETGKFNGMTPKTKEMYDSDLRQFYTFFSGNDSMPDTVKKFRDVKLKDYHNSFECRGNGQGQIPPFRLAVKGKLSEDLFAQFATNLKEMIANANKNQSELTAVLDALFVYTTDPDTKKEYIRVNPELTDDILQNIIIETRSVIVTLYLTCEKNFAEGIKIYEAIVKKKLLETTQSQIASMDKLTEKLNTVTEKVPEPAENKALEELKEKKAEENEQTKKVEVEMKPENIKDDKNVVQTPVTDDKNVVQTPVTDDKNIVQELPKQEVAAV